ncbi:hypothetical protein [Acinetobacter populi]|uniref:Uncharacterized protein n=1 Tax=Acinetobacter populi TaxID=1582270 RepID=A0A1Z9Z1H0_9GAMM|nr:hypothetical protein [Acinetobacter populi]OUY08295.1 hypothetical protein CAP51_01345 [Acinetobacter populi]
MMESQTVLSLDSYITKEQAAKSMNNVTWNNMIGARSLGQNIGGVAVSASGDVFKMENVINRMNI